MWLLRPAPENCWRGAATVTNPRVERASAAAHSPGDSIPSSLVSKICFRSGSMGGILLHARVIREPVNLRLEFCPAPTGFSIELTIIISPLAPCEYNYKIRSFVGCKDWCPVVRCLHAWGQKAFIYL